MLFQRISRRGPERIFGIFQNIDSAAMADGEVVQINVTATPVIPGSEIRKTIAVSNAVAGVVSGVIAVNDFGLVQVYGNHPNVKTTAAALAAGTIVTSDAAAAAVAGTAADDPSSRLGFSTVLGAANRANVFIKCMG